MDSKVKKWWLEDLRSGEYEQGQHALCAREVGGDRFCCLGVLYDGLLRRDVAGDYGVPPGKGWAEELRLTALGNHIIPSHTSCFSLPPSVMEAIKLSSKEQSKLVELNDCRGKSFKQIANWIDRYL